MRRWHLVLCLAGFLVVMSGCGKKKTTIPTWFKGAERPGVAVTTQEASEGPPAAQGRELQTRFEQQRWDLRKRVADLERKVEALTAVMMDLTHERGETVRKLRAAGVTSARDLQGNALAQAYARNLQQVRQELEAVQGKLQLYRVVLEEGNAVLRRVERQLKLAQAGIEDEEIVELTTALRRIDERLKADDAPMAADPLRLEAVLEEELTRDVVQ